MFLMNVPSTHSASADSAPSATNVNCSPAAPLERARRWHTSILGLNSVGTSPGAIAFVAVPRVLDVDVLRTIVTRELIVTGHDDVVPSRDIRLRAFQSNRNASRRVCKV